MENLKGVNIGEAASKLGMLFCSPFCRISFTPVDPSEYSGSDEEPYVQLLLMSTFGNARFKLTEEQVISALKQAQESMEEWSKTLAEFMDDISKEDSNADLGV